MIQPSLLDLMREPMVKRPVDKDGHVIKCEPHRTLLWRGKRHWEMARIELHPASDGLWMWSTSVAADHHGYGYRVGEKWGRFARSENDALWYAVEEMLAHIERRDGPTINAVRTWAKGLRL